MAGDLEMFVNSVPRKVTLLYFTFSLSQTELPVTSPGLISLAKRDILLMNAKQEIVLN